MPTAYEVATRFCAPKSLRFAEVAVSPTHVYGTDARALFMAPYDGARKPHEPIGFPRDVIGKIRKAVEGASALFTEVPVARLLAELEALAPKSRRCADCDEEELDLRVTHCRRLRCEADGGGRCAGDVELRRSFLGTVVFTGDHVLAGDAPQPTRWSWTLAPYWLGLALEALRDLGIADVDVREPRGWREERADDPARGVALVRGGVVVVVMPKRLA